MKFDMFYFLNIVNARQNFYFFEEKNHKKYEFEACY